MSDAEALMWRLEHDPHLSSTFGTVTVLDRVPDFDAFRRRFERAVIDIPRLRQRVQPAPGNLSPPVWVDDPDFDLNLHVRRVACPKPGTLREVLDMAALFIADPFDRTRPLWQFVVVEGMRGGKAAIIQKMHHTITDGERGVELSLSYLDFERDAPEPPQVEDTSDGDGGDEFDWGAFVSGGVSNELVKEVLANALRIPVGVTRQVRELLSDPAGLPQASTNAARTLQSVLTTLGDTEAARSPLWVERSLRRRVETTQAPFRATKDAAKRLGGTLNTAFVAAAAHAASYYHRQLGSPTESLRASMAVSTRGDESGSNAFSILRVLVPTDDVPIADRFVAIQTEIERARESTRGAGMGTLATLAAALPTSVVTHLARQQTHTVDFATSNVKGAPVPLYVAGSGVTAIYPIGPLAGVACNLTLMSYHGSLDIAVNTDVAAVTEPRLMVEGLDRAFKEFANVGVATS